MFNNVFEFGEGIFANGLIISLGIIFVVYLVARFILRIIINLINKYAKSKGRDNDMVFILFKKIVSFAIYTIVVIVIFYEIIPLRNLGTAILGLSGVATVVVALGTQEFAGNFVSGIVLSAYEPFQKGDLINLVDKGLVGTIEDLNFRHCTIRTPDNSVIIVPNKVLNEAIVENRGSAKSEPYYNSYIYGIGYDSDYKKAKELIYNYLNQHKLVLRKEDIMVLVSNLADSSIEIKVRVYTLTPAYGAILKAQLNEYILDSFKEANIEIPYQYINIINK